MSFIIYITLLITFWICFTYSEAVLELTNENFDRVLNENHPPILIEFSAPWCDHCRNLAPEYEKVAQAFRKYPGEVLIARIDADLYRDFGTRFVVKSYPVLKWFEKGDLLGEDYTGPRTALDITHFINSKTNLNAKIKTFRNDSIVLTSENFDQIVLNPENDVLVEFYAPWCGHCKLLSPIYERVATSFADEPNCIVAKIDADTYRKIGEKYQINGYPTIKFFSKTNKNSIGYEDDRDEKSFIKFLNEKCGTKRVLGGGYQSDVGRSFEMDNIVGNFMNVDKSEKENIIKKLEQQLVSTSEFYYYINVMKKIFEKGNEFLINEKTRLLMIIEFENLTAQHISKISKKLNVLNLFIEKS